MQFSQDALAAILLTCSLSPNKEELVKPLNTAEFYAFCKRVEASKFKSIGRVIKLDMSGFTYYMDYTEQEAYRFCMLFDRMFPLSVLVERLYGEDMGIATVYDDKYPPQCLQKLGAKAPPILYFSGRPELARQASVAIVGNRDSDAETIKRMRAFVRAAVEREYVIVTDGTLGLARFAEEEALACGGRIISVMAGGLAPRTHAEVLGDMVTQRRAMAFSIEHPDAVYTLPHALMRNKIVYSLAHAAAVFSADYKNGPVWEGAMEALRNNTCDFIYAPDDDKTDGTRPLLAKGALPLSPTAEQDMGRMSDSWRFAQARQISLFD